MTTDVGRIANLDLDQPLPKVLPMAQLEKGAVLFVWGVRRWPSLATGDCAAAAALHAPYSRAGCARAVVRLEDLLSVVELSARRPLARKCVHGRLLSADERLLLSILVGLQRGDVDGSRRVASSLVRQRLVSAVLQLAAHYVAELRHVGLSIGVGPALRLVS